MSRVGQNPFKWITLDQKPQKITIVTVVYIPELSGYWKNALAVLERCIDSLYENTSQLFDLMVLDNGSCKEVKTYLWDNYDKDKIQFLLFSKYNLGKIGAMDYLFSVAPGEIISFTDSDVYFCKNWLNATLKILDSFPMSGMVSAIPTIDKSLDFYESTHKGIKESKNLVIKKGNNLIPENYIEAHRLSLGKTTSAYMGKINNRLDTMITRNDINAYVCAQDFQFTTKKDVIRKILPLEVTNQNEYYDPIYSPVFESKIDELGYWRLSTEKYLIHHIGNNLDSLDIELSLIQGKQGVEKSEETTKSMRKESLSSRVIKHPVIRSILKNIYTRIYRLLYEI